MYFDNSSTEAVSGAGVVVKSPQGQRWTNKQAEYEALIIGLGILKEMKATQQDELYRKEFDGLLLLCLNAKDALTIMGKSQEEICGAHPSSIKMRWLIRRHDYYWLTILKDCIEYARGCIKCQIYDPIQRVLAEALHPITKPWPFKGWAVDIIGKISPPASNQHAWIPV
ncbi:unnamed protein product [Prunus armeniaca]